MVKISKAQGSGAAANYFEKEYSNPRESYYLEAEQEEIKGEYFGELAREIGLWEVTEETFHRLIEGQDPMTGEQRIKHVASKTYDDKFGNKVVTKEHRAGWDIVLSCPDTFSLCAGPGGDKRIAQWQREAVKETLAEMEKYIGAKDGGNGHHTGKMIGALFQHDCARPDRETGYAAPNLHDHFFLMNMTQDERGKWRAVEIDTLYEVRDFATILHWSKLAEKAVRGGYDIEISPRTGAPEIAGFSTEYLAENSRRRDEVLRNEARLKAEARERGITVDDASLRGEAARMNRRSKKFDQEEMRARHLQLDARFSYQARNRVDRALARSQVMWRENPELNRESVSYGVEHALEREAVVKRVEIEKHALWRGQGRVTYDQIKAEIDERIRTGELIEIARGRGPEMTSRRMVELERENIARMRAGQGRNRQIVHPDSVDIKINDAAERNLGFHLNRSQHQAVRSILTSEDQIMGLQGYAGVGKTTTLKGLKSVLEGSGYEVRGLAPQGRPAKLLADAGIQAMTLQKFVASQLENEPIARYYILDESSLADTQGMNTFLRRLRPVDRVLEVGDLKQHQAVNAGAPFQQHQQAGMHTAVIDDIQRQKDPGLKKVVELFANGQARKATELLISQGRVKEVEDPHGRIAAIAKDYAASPNAIVICPRNAEREQTNREIHAALQDLGQVERTERQTTIYVSRDVTGAQRKVAASYQVGDFLRYNTGSKKHKIKAGEYREVVRVDAENNRLAVMDGKGRTVEYDPKELKGVAVYREEERNFSVGDRIQFRAPYPEKRITTSEVGYVERIEGDRMTIRMDDEKQKRISIDLSNYKHIDYGYAVTSQGSQGLEAYRAIINANAYEGRQLLNERMGYVADSRAAHDVTIYTNSIEELPAALDRKQDKETALKAVWETGKTQAKREIAAEERERQAIEKQQPASLRPEREDARALHVAQQRQGQEKRERGVEIAPATNQVSREERTQAEQKPTAQQQRQQAAQAELGFASVLREDRTKVGEVVRALKRIVGVSGEMRGNPSTDERASDIAAWVRHGQQMAEKLGVIPVLPLDAEIKNTLMEAFKSLHSITRAYEYGQIPRGYAFQSTNIAREALSKVQADLLTWELARSVSHANGNFDIMAKMIQQGGRVEKLWMHGGPGEDNLSVFKVRNLSGTYTAYQDGIDKTSMGFDDRISLFGHGDPKDSRRVKEIEYDPIKIRAEQIEQQRAQVRQVERGQEQNKDSHDYGLSR